MNEAFAPQFLSVEKALGLDPEKTNVNGGAIALGHPVGASGSRITANLIYELRQVFDREGCFDFVEDNSFITAYFFRNCFEARRQTLIIFYCLSL